MRKTTKGLVLGIGAILLATIAIAKSTDGVTVKPRKLNRHGAVATGSSTLQSPAPEVESHQVAELPQSEHGLATTTAFEPLAQITFPVELQNDPQGMMMWLVGLPNDELSRIDRSGALNEYIAIVAEHLCQNRTLGEDAALVQLDNFLQMINLRIQSLNG